MDAFRCQDQVYVLYTDFSRAFDQVSYAVLVKVLTDYGIGEIGEPLLSWLKSYFLNRQQQVNYIGLN